MGATRESNWSGGILAAWSCAKDVGVHGVGGMYAHAFPGTIANEQTITSTSRNVALKNFGSGFTAVFGPVTLSPIGSVEQPCPSGVSLPPRTPLRTESHVGPTPGCANW